MSAIRNIARRALSQTAIRASGAPPGATDDPKFYSMVLEFTESAADILENKLINDTEVELGRHEAVKRAQLEKAQRSAEQKKKEIQGQLMGHFWNWLMGHF